MPDFKRIKTITSYAGNARWLAECEWDDDEDLIVAGYLARNQREAIPSPYAYSPSTPLYIWNGKKVFISEVSHRRYEIYEVAPQVKIFPTDEKAADYYIRMTAHKA